MTDVQNTLQKFNGVAVRAERNLANLEDFTGPLGQRGEEISQNLVDSIRSVNELLANFAELSQSLKNKDGTIGQLINNPELYDRLNRTLGEIETLVRKLEPIVNDVRVITDKVARDPVPNGCQRHPGSTSPGRRTEVPRLPQDTCRTPTDWADFRLRLPMK